MRRTVADVLDRIQSLRTRDVASLRSAITALSRGDLTEQPDGRHRADRPDQHRRARHESTPINAIAADLRETVDSYGQARTSLSGLLGEVSTAAETLSAASAEIAAISDEAGRAVAEMARAVGEVATGAEGQAMAAEPRTRPSSDMTEPPPARPGRAGQAGRHRGRRAAPAGRRLGRPGDDDHARGASSSRAASDAIEDLGAKWARSAASSTTISSIAEQTNLWP